MKRPRVALLRGAYLGPFEAQNFEPLIGRFDIRGYVLPQNPFSLKDCRLPVATCPFPDARLFFGRSLINAWRSRIRGERYPMPGVERIVRDSDLVHTFEAWYAYTRDAAKACQRHRIPLVVTHWDTLPYRGRMKPKEHEAILAALHRASRILATSAAARRVLQQEGIPEELIIDLPMGVDCGRFSPGPRPAELAAQLRLEADEFVFLFIGRWVREKGVRELVLAFRGLLEKSPRARVRLLLVGQGSEEPWIRDYGRHLIDQGKLLLAAPVPYAEIHLWHRLADSFVFACIPTNSVEEQFGYALVEAMSCGRPVIAAPVGGVEDVVGEAGWMVPPGDVEALSQAMQQMLHDREAAERFGLRARQRVLERFSTEVAAGRLADVYDQLLFPARGAL